jgi:adenine-specific DNA-methyltransferase
LYITYKMNAEYSKLTIDITNKLSKQEKKDNGIFITPRTIIEKLFTEIKKHISNPQRILEPSAGTCEIANYAHLTFPAATINAVEFNDTIYNDVAQTVDYKYIHADFTKWSPSYTFDLIVGNPPYVVCGKGDVPEKYHDFVVGRPNLFCTFMLHSISMLSPGGVLAFVIPTSFLNAAYYAKIRNYMKIEGTILNIVNFASDNKFIETQQATIGLIFRRNPVLSECKLNECTFGDCKLSDCKFSVKFGDNYIFTENSDTIKAVLSGSTTLAKMGVVVKTGTVVWNQHKEALTSDKTKTLLIYNTNVAKTNTVVAQDFANDEKKQYILMDGAKEPIIVVNRGNGNSAYKLSYAYVDGTRPYLVENHLNMIMCKTEENARLILASFANKKTEEFVSLFLGNNGLSKTELETIFPIYA